MLQVNWSLRAPFAPILASFLVLTMLPASSSASAQQPPDNPAPAPVPAPSGPPAPAAPAVPPAPGRNQRIDAQGTGRGGFGGGFGGGNRQARPKTDFADARQKLLDAATPDPATIDVKDFGALIQAASDESTKRKLPSFTDNVENNYAPELLAFRKEVYGPLRENPVLRHFLRGLARKPSTGFDFNGATAAMVLADAPDVDDLDALFEGYGATAAESRNSLARQLGRALGALRDAQPRPPRFDEMLARVKADAAEMKS